MALHELCPAFIILNFPLFGSSHSPPSCTPSNVPNPSILASFQLPFCHQMLFPEFSQASAWSHSLKQLSLTSPTPPTSTNAPQTAFWKLFFPPQLNLWLKWKQINYFSGIISEGEEWASLTGPEWGVVWVTRLHAQMTPFMPIFSDSIKKAYVQLK